MTEGKQAVENGKGSLRCEINQKGESTLIFEYTDQEGNKQKIKINGKLPDNYFTEGITIKDVKEKGFQDFYNKQSKNEEE